MSITLTVTKDGAVALGPELLEHLGVEPGGHLSAELDSAGTISLHAAESNSRPQEPQRSGRIEDTFGALKPYYDGPPLTIEQINEAIADGWAGKR
ncbi:AbrB/MazE/SpoVT family DNA-binding domain-containing protein [Jiella pelagia]|uniref:AbrB/MazE/SpoVT family DNA-binding domain-containing protein n=1 Tax=Jiella pelagia TaxID=2986949 RepID=A0ABY7C1C0_9HYPH|nr:AbrB/MazE/SpoVT family DNA-binding domain-containing protein [Jiella pelagia]WAP69654.1 AbrB/MazE/SpoVT family DNA-binding domain-containing protein [Jiella pelagia]